MDTKSVLCEVVMKSGKVYKVRSLVNGVKLIELNDQLLTKPELLAEKPEEEGFLGILMFKSIEALAGFNSSDSSKQQLLKHVFKNEELKTKEEYFGHPNL